MDLKDVGDYVALLLVMAAAVRLARTRGATRAGHGILAAGQVEGAKAAIDAVTEGDK